MSKAELIYAGVKRFGQREVFSVGCEVVNEF